MNNNRFANDFRDLREHSVTHSLYSLTSVQPIGNPIRNSNCSGVIACPPKASTYLRQLGHFCIDGATKFAFRVGVCKGPPTISLMVSPCSKPRYTAVVRSETKASEVFSRVGDCLFLDIFCDDVPRSDGVNDPGHVGPEVSCNAASSGCGAEGLTWESAADDADVGCNSIQSKRLSCDLSNIAVYRNPRPVLRQHATLEPTDLAKCSGFKPASPVQAESKTTNTAKQVENFQHEFQTTSPDHL